MLQRLIPIFIVSVLFLSVAFTQTDLQKSYSLSIGDNYRIYPSNVTQTEVFIESHPFNNDIMFSSANAISFQPTFFKSEGIYVTTNGGTNWWGNDTCTGAILTHHGGDPGIAIDKDGTFILTRNGDQIFPGLYSHFSTDMGATWSPQLEISDADLERATLTSDVLQSSNYFGRTYAVWLKFSNPHVIMSAYTTNGAQSWSTPFQINNPPPNRRSAGGDITLGLNGKVYVCWAGLTELPLSIEDFVGIAASSDGGASWNVDETAIDMNGILGVFSEKENIRVNGFPRIAADTSGGATNGWVYVVTAQKDLAPAGTDPDIILNKSTDGGQTWSSGIRVNQDPLNNGAIQFFPAIHIDEFGGINVIFYDDRNTTSDSTGTFLARSEDGGNNWREFEISDHNFKPIPNGGLGVGYMGDNIDITSSNGKLWPVWMDNSTGIYQIWTVPIELSSVGVDEQDDNFINSFRIEQNYPNPFNPVTNIKYRIAEYGYVIMKVYDVLGKEVATLVNEEKPVGKYEVVFSGDGLPSGIYYYRLTVGSFTETRKMILLK